MSRLTPLPLAIAACALALGACQSTRRNTELAYVERPVEQLYNQAAGELDSRDYANAILLFEEVERQHPYSEWARKSMVMSAYASYKTRDYTTAISAAERYLALHPGGSEAEYAYYLIALSHFDQIVDVGRDQATTERARTALNDIVRRFPDSEYARDANLKLDMVNDQLAGKEMAIGRYYQRAGQPLAAINRYKAVIDNEAYQRTSHTPEALYRLVEVNLVLGLKEEATRNGAVLGFNYPGSPWYAQAYALLSEEGRTPEVAPTAQRESWLRRIIPG